MAFPLTARDLERIQKMATLVERHGPAIAQMQQTVEAIAPYWDAVATAQQILASHRRRPTPTRRSALPMWIERESDPVFAEWLRGELID